MAEAPCKLAGFGDIDRLVHVYIGVNGTCQTRSIGPGLAMYQDRILSMIERFQHFENGIRRWERPGAERVIDIIDSAHLAGLNFVSDSGISQTAATEIQYGLDMVGNYNCFQRVACCTCSQCFIAIARKLRASIQSTWIDFPDITAENPNKAQKRNKSGRDNHAPDYTSPSYSGV